MPPSHRPPGDATTRFSNRVADYVKYRPAYPAEVIALLERESGLGSNSTVADVGAGTGIFTRLLLATGATVHAIEPNEAMRRALAAASPDQPRLHIHDTPAEAIGLPDHSVDLITSAQAFHWFDRDATRTQFQRILRPAGAVALIWNTRRNDTPVLGDYDGLLQKWATDYNAVKHRNIDLPHIDGFFAPGPVERHAFAYAQRFDLPGLLGRFNSSSYAPPPGHPDHEHALAALTQIFRHHAINGQIEFHYTTEVYLGRFA